MSAEHFFHAVRGASKYQFALSSRVIAAHTSCAGCRAQPSAFFYRRERVRVFISPTQILEQGQKRAERALLIDPPRASCYP